MPEETLGERTKRENTLNAKLGINRVLLINGALTDLRRTHNDEEIQFALKILMANSIEEEPILRLSAL